MKRKRWCVGLGVLGLGIAGGAWFLVLLEAFEPCAVEVCFLMKDGSLTCGVTPLRMRSAGVFHVPSENLTDRGMVRITCKAWGAGSDQKAIDDGGAIPL